MNITAILHGLWRMDFAWPCYFSSGKPGCCRVWYYQTPWGAAYGAMRLHALRTRPKPSPEIRAWAEARATDIERFRASWSTFGGRDSNPPVEEPQ